MRPLEDVVEPRGCPTPGACSCIGRRGLEDVARDVVAAWRDIDRYDPSYGDVQQFIEELERVLAKPPADAPLFHGAFDDDDAA